MLLNPGVKRPQQACFVQLGEQGPKLFADFLDGSGIFEALITDLLKVLDSWLLCRGQDSGSGQ